MDRNDGRDRPRAKVPRKSTARDNILKKRRALARRRRKALLRLTLLLMIFGLVLAGVAFAGLTLVNWGQHIYGEYQKMYAGYTERQEARRGAVDPRFDGYTNVLVLGLDDGAGGMQGPPDAEGQPAKIKKADTILVVSMDNSTGRIRFINIPRDTLVTVPVTGVQARLADVYPAGGAPLMVRQVNSLLGISIHQYVVMDMKAFAHFIDALGGIDVYVETNMDYQDPEAGLTIHLEQGYRHLDGAKSLEYLRYRGEELGDVGRVQRQQKFVKAVYSKILQFETLPKLPAIADIFKNEVETSAEVFDSAHLANVLRGISSEQPISVMLPGSTAENDYTIWIPDGAGIQSRMQELFRPSDIEQSESTDKEEKND